jgi:hypothetical protein
MLAEKFFLVLETLRSIASDGSVKATRRMFPSRRCLKTSSNSEF